MLRPVIGFAILSIAGATSAAGQGTKIDGEKVYAAQKCALCHSIGARGNKKGRLDGVASKLKAEDIRKWIVDAKGMAAKTKASRRPLMKSYTLPKGDVDALVAYMMTLKK